MKRIAKTIIIMTLFFIAATTFTTSVNVAAQDHSVGGENDCTDSSETLTIDTHPTDLAFNKVELKATKGVCVKFIFMNTQSIDHDFTIMKDGEEWTHLDLKNNLDNETGPAPGQREVLRMMPNEDVTLTFLCTVPGHEAAGMKGKLIVGEGSPSEDDSPGFGFLSIFVSIVALMSITSIVKRKK